MSATGWKSCAARSGGLSKDCLAMPNCGIVDRPNTSCERRGRTNLQSVLEERLRTRLTRVTQPKLQGSSAPSITGSLGGCNRDNSFSTEAIALGF